MGVDGGLTLESQQGSMSPLLGKVLVGRREAQLWQGVGVEECSMGPEAAVILLVVTQLELGEV